MAQQVVSSVVRAVRSNRKFTPQRAAITLTPSAVEKVRNLLSANRDSIALRVGVRTRGCSGLSYTLEHASEKKKMDEEVVQDGVKILIDSKAQLTLLGTEMDYVENKLSSEFVFHNPNVKGTCGCGESFHVE